MKKDNVMNWSFDIFEGGKYATPDSTLFSIKLEDRQCNGEKYDCTQVSLMLCFLSFSWLMNHEEDKKNVADMPSI